MDALREVSRALLEGGPLRLSTSVVSGDWISEEHDAALVRLDEVARANAPGRAPALDLGAARWGLGRVAHLAQRLVARADGGELVLKEFVRHRGLGAPPKRGPKSGPESGAESGAESVWSVDLALRHMASIERAARGLVATDPLRLELIALARDWPFSGALIPSSIGAKSETPALPECLSSHPSLRRMYLDRVTRARSVAHGQVPWVTGALIEDLGRRPRWLPAVPSS